MIIENEAQNRHPVLQELAQEQQRAFIDQLTAQRELKEIFLQLLKNPQLPVYINSYSDSWRNFQAYFADLQRDKDTQGSWQFSMIAEERCLQISFVPFTTGRLIRASDISSLYNRINFMQDYPVDWPEEESFG